MKKLLFKDYEDFACHLFEIFEEFETDEDLTIIAKYDDAKEILAELIKLEYPIVKIDLESDDFNYDKEYYINLGIDGIWCSKAFNEKTNDYYYDEPIVAYFLGDCNSKTIQSIRDCLKFEVYIGKEDDDENDCDGNCQNCKFTHEIGEYISEDNNSDEDDIKGFTISGNEGNTSWSKSFYSSDEELVRKMMEFWK